MIKNPSRFKRVDEYGWAIMLTYLGFAIWGVVCIFVPVRTLSTSAGDSLTFAIAVSLIIGGLIGLAGYIVEATSAPEADVIEFEIVGTIFLSGAWGTYTIVVWVLTLAPPEGVGPPLAAPFAVLVSIVMALFLLRLGTLTWRSLKVIALIVAARRRGITAATPIEEAVERVMPE